VVANSPTSSPSKAPIGKPSRRMRGISAKTRIASLTGIRVGIISMYPAKQNSISHCTMAVAQPEPALPQAGMPTWPKIRAQLSAALAGIASSGTIMTMRVRNIATSRKRSTAKPRKAGAPQRIIRR
jgi:hypothetical protein